MKEPHYTNVFYKGNVGMVPIGNWFVGMLWEKQEAGEIDFNWDIAAMPTPDGVSPYTSWGMAAPIAINAPLNASACVETNSTTTPITD